jgi:hypothetical protein
LGSETCEPNVWVWVKLGTQLGVYIGGSSAWTKLVDALDDLFADRGDRILARLRERNGRNWAIARGPSTDGEDAEPVGRLESEA